MTSLFGAEFFIDLSLLEVMHTEGLPHRPAAAQVQRWTRLAARTVQGLISLIYPPSCAGCGLPLCDDLREPFCPECEEALDLIQQPYCPSCGMPNSRTAPKPHLCGDCLKGVHQFDGARANGPYRGLLREVIHRLKYQGQTFLARPLAQMLTAPGLELASLHKIEVIIPVPLHYHRLRHRGFNQAALLANRLGSNLGISVDYSSLTRSRSTEPQAGLSRKQRAANVKGAFDLTDPGRIRKKCVLLLDDVLTTGETVNQCSRVLKAGGANQVVVLTVARTVA